MTIIKVDVEIQKGEDFKSFVVELVRQSHRTIGEFVTHIKDVCNIEEDEGYALSIDGYILPMKESSEMLYKKHVYSLIQTDYFQDKSNISKKQQKINKINQKIVHKMRKPSSSSSSSSSSQSQSQSSQQIKPKIIFKKINQKPQRKTPITKKKIVQPQSESSSSSSQQQLPHAPIKIQKHAQISKTNSTPLSQKIVANPRILKPKTIIVESSESQSITPAQQKKKEIPKSIPNQKSKIPPALRNKPAKSTFSAYKQAQWISVTKESIIKFVAKGHSTFCQPNNSIRFKLIELDEQKFIPILSDWITSDVERVDENGKVYLRNFRKGKQFLSTFEIQQHNMDSLEIAKLHATHDQLEVLSQNNKPVESQQSEKKENEDKKEEKISQLHIPHQGPDKDSIQKFIVGQINYYFSDKNYNTDLYMQMHANNHPQKYINVKFFLNFPKIKKILRDEQKLFEYLIQDEKRSDRNYQIDEKTRMVRKKQLIKEKQGQKISKQQIKNAQ